MFKVACLVYSTAKHTHFIVVKYEIKVVIIIIAHEKEENNQLLTFVKLKPEILVSVIVNHYKSGSYM